MSRMAKYIYKSDALNVITKLINENKRRYDTSFHKGKRAVLIEALEEIEKIKGADEKPVKRGTWHKDEQGYDAYVECSECGLDLSTSNYIENEWREILKYCPCCGARMDGGEEDENSN